MYNLYVQGTGLENSFSLERVPGCSTSSGVAQTQTQWASDVSPQVWASERVGSGHIRLRL